MANLDIRKKIASNFLKHWEIAMELNIHEAVLCRWLRKELSTEKKDLILAAIEKLSKEGR
ncbi:hypothetical protein [Pelosinus sp. sgz500959]|uniref:hypothetical protein n=1 Tax=Pelosinus sp. sgz500959 TaxID=3242472 RepID=UPI003671771B